MKTLLLMRHGDAPHAIKDSERMLSDYGKQQCSSMARHISKENIKKVITSDYQRAIDSAALIGSQIAPSILNETTDLLRPSADFYLGFKFLLNQLDELEDQSELLVVCHLPIIAYLASLSIDGDVNDNYAFPAASLMCLQTEIPSHGGFDLLWHKHASY